MAAIPGRPRSSRRSRRLLGVRVDYYALVNLRGFADLVDGLGGVRILVKERLVDEVTRPAWGEPKPRIDVQPGRRYHFYGREALAYVRSRKDSNDYTRMARQRCFLSAMADQLDPVRVLRNFPGWLGRSRRTCRPTCRCGRLPALIRLVGGIDPKETLTETFGATYIASRRKVDNYPLPKLGLMRQTVREAILSRIARAPIAVWCQPARAAERGSPFGHFLVLGLFLRYVPASDPGPLPT